MNTARIVRENKTNYVIIDNEKEITGVMRGSFHQKANYPKVGDYVVYTQTAKEQAVIEEIIPRKSAIVRKAAGSSTAQVIVANVDLIFIVMGLDKDFNLNRLDRYVLLAEQSNVASVIILNKSDLSTDPSLFFNQVSKSFSNIPVEIISATTGHNMEALAGYLSKDVTVVLLGSSGAGKSTIANWLLHQKVQETKEVREDDSHGRHTTTSRELFALPGGGYLIDTPGMRELGLVGEVEGDTFRDIEFLARGCKFNDCDHERSSGCVVQDALVKGELSKKHFDNYIKLKKEKDYFDRKAEQESEWRHRQNVRKIHKDRKKILKRKYLEKGY